MAARTKGAAARGDDANDRKAGRRAADVRPKRADKPRRPARATGYLHGYSAEERDRLRRQARVLEPMVHDRLPFGRRRRLVEIGSGVGAQTEILLRHFPELHVVCVERDGGQLAEAKRFLATVPWAKGRYETAQQDASRLSFERESFDSAFLCWILEHVADPARVLSEARRVLTPGAPIVVNEVLNATFFIDPYSPRTLQYWMAFNDRQIELGGDPFIGAKLGNLLQAVGFRDIVTLVKTFHFDNRTPGERAEFLAYWTDLLLSGAPELLAARKVSAETVDGMKRELDRVAREPSSVFFYSFIQAQATA
ncbi:MAG TPA: methyltransferase domain-containing protein [Planctomycetota bacterium]|nr:methyltransferase domain-containing protein [Planctomycetota bacterium]